MVRDTDKTDGADPGRRWMLEIQRGDERSFHRLVQHYGRRVTSFLLRYGADAGTAEDLSQEVFLRIWRARDRYRPEAKFSTYLHQVTLRVAINDGTRNRWRKARSLDGEESGLLEDTGKGLDDEPSRSAEREELRELVQGAVATLPENQKTALLLNRFDGLSYEEVAEVMGMQVPAVKSLLFRARENLRKRLAAEMPEEVKDGR